MKARPRAADGLRLIYNVFWDPASDDELGPYCPYCIERSDRRSRMEARQHDLRCFTCGETVDFVVGAQYPPLSLAPDPF